MTPTTAAERQAKFSETQREWLLKRFGMKAPRTLVTALMKLTDKQIETLRRMVETQKG